MKSFIASVLLMLSAWFCQAATGSGPITYHMLSTNDFRVDTQGFVWLRLSVSAGTNLYITNLYVSNFFATNITVQVLNGDTNVLLWTNSAGVYQPTTTQNSLVANGVTSINSLIANGSLIIQPSSGIALDAGANFIPTSQQSFMRFSSAFDTVDPTLCTAYITMGDGLGQILFIENMTNLFANSAFQILNGTPTGDGLGTVTLLNGDWKPTQPGETLLLQNDGFGWREVARFYGAAGASSIPILNPTVDYYPKRGPATNLVNSLVHDDGSVVTVDGASPSTIQLVSEDGQIVWGSNTNVLKRVNTQLIWTNGATTGNGVTIGVINGNGVEAIFGVDQDEHVAVVAPAGKTVRIEPNNSSPRYTFSSTGLYPDSLVPLGIDGAAWGTNLYLAGFQPNPTNYSRLKITHTGTNILDAIAFDSQSAGIAGSPRPMHFDFGGTTRLALSAVSGATFTDPLARLFVSSALQYSADASVTGWLSDGRLELDTGASAVLNTQENSPALVLRGNGWSTTPSTSEAVYMGQFVVPIQGLRATGELRFVSQKPGSSTTTNAVITTENAFILSPITKAQKTALTPREGMIVFQSDNTPGLRVYQSGAWVMPSVVADP